MKRKKVGIKISPGLHRDVKLEATRREMSMEDAYEQGMAAWLTGAVVTPPGEISIPLSMRSVVEFTLDWFATEGTPEIEAIKVAIRQMAAQRKADLERNTSEGHAPAPVTEFPQQKEERTVTELDKKKRVSNGG